MNYKKEIDFLSLNEEVSRNLSLILNYFGIRYRYQKNIYSFPCPVHGGKGHNCRIRVTPKTCRWVCWSNHCEKEYGDTIYGFIAALMKQEDPDFTKREAVDFCIDLLGLDDEKLRQSEVNRDRINFVNMCKRSEKRGNNKKIFGRKELREKLNIPSVHFVNRGFSPEILDRYDVGFCKNGNYDMKERVIFPVYDDNHEFVIGTVGRTLKPKCDKCGKYHSPNEPCPQTDLEKMRCSKWRNSYDFESGEVFFNYWFAKKYIKDNFTVILVEGQGDVLKIEQAGIHNSLGIFGTSLKAGQIKKLQSTGVMNVILALDGDKEGQKGNSIIEEQLERYYNVYKAEVPKNKDIGDLDEAEIISIFKPILEKVDYETKNLST